MTLEELFNTHLTDKGTHGYHTFYEQLISNPATITTVLEVGIGTCNPDAVSTTVGWFPDHYRPGASLRAWADYFPNAHIWGIDPQPDCMFDDDPRITTILGSSTSPLADLEFDVIIDDGDHSPASQLATLANLWPHVKPGGLYVIEDVYSVNIYDVADIVGLSNWCNTQLRPSQSWKFVAIAIRKAAP